MQTKLTLRLEDELIRKAKRYSKKTGKSVSTIVADYFEKLDTSSEDIKGITPKVAALKGILKKSDTSEEEYYRHLEEKYL